MKKSTFLLFIFSCSILYSQSVSQKKIDSINILINNTSDKIKETKLLNELGSTYLSVNIDSAKTIFKKVNLNAIEINDTELKFNSFVGLGKSYAFSSKYDSANTFYKKAEELIIDNDDYELNSVLLMNKGILYFYKADYVTAEKIFKQALELALINNNIEDLSRCYNNIALCLAYRGNYEEALKMHVESAKIAEDQNDQIGLAKSYNNIGLIYKDLEEYQKAEEYMLKSLKIKESEGNNIGVIGSYLNLGSIFRKIGIDSKDDTYLNKSKTYYLNSLKLSEEVNYTIGINNGYVNLALIETTLENFDKGIEYGKMAVKINQEAKDQNKEMIARINLGDTYRFKKEYFLAEQELLKGLKLAELQDNKHIKKETLLILSRLHTDKNNFEKALNYHKKYISLHDSISSSDVKNKVNELETKFETEKKEKEIAIQKEELLKQELEIKNKNLYALLLGSGILLLSLLSFGIYKYQINKRKQLRLQLELKDQLALTKTQNKLQEQRLHISRDLHDNIGSQLTFIISSIDNLKFLTKASNSKLKDKLSDINNFASSTISELRDTIWAMNKNEISYEDFYGRLLTFIEKAKLVKEDIKFNLSSSITSSPKFSSVEGINVFRVIQESINNSIKYAEASEIEIQLSENKKQIEINIEDNGKGFDINEIEFGNGLNNMQHRISEINGTISVNSKPKIGTKIALQIPKNT